MPTGYTAGLYEGDESFQKFIWRAARGMGALIAMRDEPHDAPIPEVFEPGDYYPKEIEKLEARLQALSDSSNDELMAEMDAEREARRQRVLEEYEKKAAMKARYEAMLAQVKAWQPPSVDHEGLKEFMTDQLKESIRFDCGTFPDIGRPAGMTAGDYREAMERSLTEQLERCRKNYAEEIERYEGRTRWVAQLRASVGEPPQNKVAIEEEG